MKIKTADLIGPALDWAVAKCEGETNHVQFSPLASSKHYFAPSKKWSQGGPIIEREGIYLRANDTVTKWAAGALRKNRLDKKPSPWFYAKTPLVAAMCCFVSSKLGDEVDVPEELL